MLNKKFSTLTALAGLALLGSTQIASAATVSCPGVLGGDLNRQITVTGALAGGECYYKEGNFQGDNVDAYLGADMYTQIDKDVASDNEGGEGGLLYTLTNANNAAGTWTMGSNFWNTYAEVFLGFHFGNGSGSPDSFIVELDPGTLTGTWALSPLNRVNGLSNAYLWGRGTAVGDDDDDDGDGDDDDTDLPEPGSLALLGLGLMGLGASRRRRNK